MSTNRFVDVFCVLIIILGIGITIAFMNGEELGIQIAIDSDSENYNGSELITNNDIDANWDRNDASIVVMSGNDGTVNGTGAYFYDGNLVIGQSGKYVISGNLNDGSIIVDASKGAKVWILFDGVSAYCDDSASFIVKKADKVFLTLNDGTTNMLSSGEKYSKEAKDEKYEGTISVKEDLTINGTGKLIIKSTEKHGIDCKDSLVLANCIIDISSKKDAIHAKHDISIVGADITINSGDDGITTSDSVNIENSKINIMDCYEGIEGAIINVYSGEININPRDDGINARKEGSDLSTDSLIYIAGGTITIVNSTANDADGLDSNGDIIISGGNVFISLVNNGMNTAIDYGSECGGVCIIPGGRVIACGSYIMAEGFDELSTQASILYGYSKAAKEDTLVTLEDNSGNIICSAIVPCSFSSVTISTPEIVIGESYKIRIGEDEEDIVVESVAASYGDVQSSMFGGPMNWGGAQKGDNSHRPDGGDNWGKGEKGGNPPDDGLDKTNIEMNERHDPDMPDLPDDIKKKRDDFNVANNANISNLETEPEHIADDDKSSITDVPADTWYMVGIMTGIIGFGIVFAGLYKRR